MKTNPMQSVKWLFAFLSLTPLLAWADQAPPEQAAPNRVSQGVSQDQTYTVPSEFWERPRSGKATLEQAVLRQSVSDLLSKPGSMLVIHHNSGEEAALRAEELRAWLVALAVEATWIDMAADLPGSTELRVELITKRGQ